MNPEVKKGTVPAGPPRHALETVTPDQVRRAQPEQDMRDLRRFARQLLDSHPRALKGAFVTEAEEWRFVRTSLFDTAPSWVRRDLVHVQIDCTLTPIERLRRLEEFAQAVPGAERGHGSSHAEDGTTFTTVETVIADRHVVVSVTTPPAGQDTP